MKIGSLKNKKALGIALGLCASLSLVSCDINDIMGGDATRGQGSKYSVAEGLKVALENGIVNGVDRVGKPNGYLGDALLKIILPEDVENALNKADSIKTSLDDLSAGSFSGAIKLLGSYSETFSALDALDGMKSELIKGFNSAAEEAAPASLDIFKGAILDISFDDAEAILFSSDSSAATSYLKGKTFGGLTNLFSPMVDSTLELVNAASTWKSFSSNYNTLLTSYRSLSSSIQQNDPLGLINYKPIALDTLTTDLGSYVTGKALSGLFVVVGQEELKIRQDPFSYAANIGEAILEEVFGQLFDE